MDITQTDIDLLNTQSETKDLLLNRFEYNKKQIIAFPRFNTNIRRASKRQTDVQRRNPMKNLEFYDIKEDFPTSDRSYSSKSKENLSEKSLLSVNLS